MVGGGLLNPNYLVNTCTQAYRIIIIITVITIIINLIGRWGTNREPSCNANFSIFPSNYLHLRL